MKRNFYIFIFFVFLFSNGYGNTESVKTYFSVNEDSTVTVLRLKLVDNKTSTFITKYIYPGEAIKCTVIGNDYKEEKKLGGVITKITKDEIILDQVKRIPINSIKKIKKKRNARKTSLGFVLLGLGLLFLLIGEFRRETNPGLQNNPVSSFLDYKPVSAGVFYAFSFISFLIGVVLLISPSTPLSNSFNNQQAPNGYWEAEAVEMPRSQVKR